VARGDARHDVGADRSPLRGTLVLVLLIALVAGGIATWRYDLVERWRGDRAPDGPAAPPDPVAVAPPEGVEVPEVVAPPAVAVASDDGTGVDAAAVRRLLNRYLRSRDLGPHVLAEVAPLAGGPVTYTRGGAADTAIPASTTKVVTSAAALLAMGPEEVFSTEVRRQGRRITLVGGGDPFLERGPLDEGQPWPYPERATLADLAAATADALRADGVGAVRLSYDDSLFAGPAVNPTWEDDYVPDDVVSPTTALWVDQGREPGGSARVADPSAEAARSFAVALRAEGVPVRGEPVAAPAPEQPAIASVDSAPLGRIVERLLDVSDNEATEVLLRQVGVATGGDGSIEAGRDGVRRLLRRAGVPLGGSVLHDGSGLSRANRVDPSTLVGILRLAASDDHPDLRPVMTGLPVAAFTGSLTDRMSEGPPEGRGRVRAKTGTLTGVRSLAGVATLPDGAVVAFVLMADRIRDDRNDLASRRLDEAAVALGACRCSAG
jgi:D-alanyl-D-alanine carboxypeptidase/D-alanyl-D-alanine-endopeptidase (penicillin-binding protein 4)